MGIFGSGKSALFHMPGRLDQPISGTVTADSKSIFTPKDEALTIFSAQCCSVVERLRQE